MINNENIDNQDEVVISKVTIWLPEGLSKDHWVHRVQYLGGSSSFQNETVNTLVPDQPVGKAVSQKSILLLVNDA